MSFRAFLFFDPHTEAHASPRPLNGKKVIRKIYYGSGNNNNRQKEREHESDSQQTYRKNKILSDKKKNKKWMLS